jgi:catechol 2,3-dioxygenase-like lactoylglutathione lyase family enzyme
MILNHINLGVSDVPATVAMFETYFGLTAPPGMPTTDRMAFLTDDVGALVSLFKVNDVTYPKIFHIGFTQKTVAEVLAIRDRLLAGGFTPDAAREEHGRFTFYFRAPGGFTVEVNAFLPRA